MGKADSNFENSNAYCIEFDDKAIARVAMKTQPTVAIQQPL
jgi:hypothetical protein